MARKDDTVGDPDEFVLEDDDADNLEGALQDALEAVERRERQAGEGPVEGAEEPAAERAAGPGVADLEAELDRTQDHLIRALADFDNYRKRTEKERQEHRRYAGLEVLRDFLPIVDNLERAVESAGEAEDLKTGVELILRQIQELLDRHGVSKIEAVGRAFDPRLHDALSREEDPDATEPRVSEELVAGYEMYDRLLRPAQVRVAMPVEPLPEGGEPSEDA